MSLHRVYPTEEHNPSPARLLDAGRDIVGGNVDPVRNDRDGCAKSHLTNAFAFGLRGRMKARGSLDGEPLPQPPHRFLSHIRPLTGPTSQNSSGRGNERTSRAAHGEPRVYVWQHPKAVVVNELNVPSFVHERSMHTRRNPEGPKKPPRPLGVLVNLDPRGDASATARQDMQANFYARVDKRSTKSRDAVRRAHRLVADGRDHMSSSESLHPVRFTSRSSVRTVAHVSCGLTSALGSHSGSRQIARSRLGNGHRPRTVAGQVPRGNWRRSGGVGKRAAADWAR